MNKILGHVHRKQNTCKKLYEGESREKQVLTLSGYILEGLGNKNNHEISNLEGIKHYKNKKYHGTKDWKYYWQKEVILVEKYTCTYIHANILSKHTLIAYSHKSLA